MDHLFALLKNPFLWIVGGAYYGFMAAVDAMPAPDPGDSKTYWFFYRFLNRLAGNLKKVAATLHVPGADEQQPKQ